MTDISIRDLVGRRCLVVVETTGYGTFNTSSGVDEMKILEISPSGQWVKIMNMDGRRFWRAVGNVAVIEVLEDSKSPSEWESKI